MAAGCGFSRSPTYFVLFACCLIFNGFLNAKICVRNPRTHLFFATSIIDFEKTINLHVVSILRFCHLVLHLDFGTRLKGKKEYFAAGMLRYPNSVSTFNVSRLAQCGDIEINPGPDHLTSNPFGSSLVMCVRILFVQTRKVSSVMVATSGST